MSLVLNIVLDHHCLRSLCSAPHCSAAIGSFHAYLSHAASRSLCSLSANVGTGSLGVATSTFGSLRHI